MRIPTHFPDGSSRLHSTCRSLFLVWLVFTCWPGEAQCLLGVQGGTNFPYFSTYTPDPHSSFSSSNTKIAPQFGLVLKGRHGKNMTCGLELNYREQSSDLNMYSGGLGGGSGVNGHFNMGYLGLMILPEIRFGDKVEIYFNSGFRLGFLVSSHVVGYENGWNMAFNPGASTGYTRAVNGSASGYLSHVDMGHVFGVGINVKVTDHYRLTFGSRMTTSVDDGSITWIKSVDYGFTLGLLYRFGTNPLSSFLTGNKVFRIYSVPAFS